VFRAWLVFVLTPSVWLFVIGMVWFGSCGFVHGIGVRSVI